LQSGLTQEETLLPASVAGEPAVDETIMCPGFFASPSPTAKGASSMSINSSRSYTGKPIEGFGFVACGRPDFPGTILFAGSFADAST
jgi:hypothetical protein